MITHRKNKWITAWFCGHAKSLLRKNFRKISLTESSQKPVFEPDTPVIAVANHSSWWDPMLAMYLSFYYFRKEFLGVMAEEQLRRYGIFRYVGVYSVDRSSPHEGATFLKYTRRVLEGKGRLLWVYAQGDLVSCEETPVVLKKGFAQIAALFPKVHLLKLIASYDFWVESKPEIVIDILPLETLCPARGTRGAETLRRRVGEEMTARLAQVRNIVRKRHTSALKPLFVADRGTHPVYDLYRRAKFMIQKQSFTVRHGAD